MFNHINIGTDPIEVRAERRSHAVGRADAPEAQSIHQRIQAAICHGSARISPIRKQVISRRGSLLAQVGQKLHGLS